MAKNGQLWDDSALVKALDDAISKFKIMHDKGGYSGHPKEGKITKDTEESVSDVINESNEAKGALYEETDNITVTEEFTSEFDEPDVDPSNGDQVQDSESAKHYNLLLNQYKAIEEQRQKLLVQLYQYGNWDPQSYGYGYGYVPYGYGYRAGYDTQYHTVSAPQTSELPMCSCRPYVCPYSTSLAHNGSSASVEDDAFIKAAMGAVNSAIPSFYKETSDGRKVQEVETTSQMDLSVVLNAWFSAGFYTGKYLSEQASAKK